MTTLAIARISKRYPDDSAITVEVEVRDSFPDCVAECVAQVIHLWSLTPNDDEVGEGE